MTDYPALIRQLLEALEEERRIRILGQSPECGIVHWESIRDLRRRAYENTDVAITAARAALKAPPKQEPVALVTYHRDDTGQKAAEAYAAMVAQLSKENIRKLANEVAHGAKATLGRESIALTREDWSDIKLIPLATPQPQPAIPQGTQPAMGQFTLTEDGAERLTWLLATDGGEGKEITLSIGMGHSGFGLYAWEAEYPEEGATFIETTSKPELFVAPPSPANPQGWQGLTDEELSDIYNSSEWSFDADWDYERAIEAALREKNAALAASPTPAPPCGCT